ncbi:MAG: hypothetical protein LBT05_05160 [Planctomycetaceae bacterium]|jgi:hypothetical protein|nr:hypothetical protein [Planctomycetaceae bacterium]
MYYLGIDLHKSQITINLRNEDGKIVKQSQMSADHAKIAEFFGNLQKQTDSDGGYMAIVEI